MIPAELDYRAPASLEEAIRILSSTPDAKVLGGGMSLIPALKHRLVQPTALVDLTRIPGLDGVSLRDGLVVIGGRATHSAVLGSAAAQKLPVLREAADQIGDLQVRNRGTFAGSLVHADPAADWPAVFLALDGVADVAGPRGLRSIAAKDFFAGMMTSAVASNEIVTEVRLSVGPARSGSAYGSCVSPPPASPSSAWRPTSSSTSEAGSAPGRPRRDRRQRRALPGEEHRSAAPGAGAGREGLPQQLRGDDRSRSDGGSPRQRRIPPPPALGLRRSHAAEGLRAGGRVKIEGHEQVEVAPDLAWRMINDPAVLKACTPGLEILVETRPDHFDAELALQLPLLKGRFTGSVDILSAWSASFCGSG